MMTMTHLRSHEDAVSWRPPNDDIQVTTKVPLGFDGKTSWFHSKMPLMIGVTFVNWNLKSGRPHLEILLKASNLFSKDCLTERK